jgi:hypothetical protein
MGAVSWHRASEVLFTDDASDPYFVFGNSLARDHRVQSRLTQSFIYWDRSDYAKIL